MLGERSTCLCRGCGAGWDTGVAAVWVCWAHGQAVTHWCLSGMLVSKCIILLCWEVGAEQGRGGSCLYHTSVHLPGPFTLLLSGGTLLTLPFCFFNFLTKRALNCAQSFLSSVCGVN